MKTASRPFHSDPNSLWIVIATVAAFGAGIFAFIAYRSRVDAERGWLLSREEYKKALDLEKKYYEIASQADKGAVLKIEEQDRIQSFLDAEMGKREIKWKGINPQKGQPRNGWIQYSFQIDLDEKGGPYPRDKFAGFLREVERIRPWLKSRDISISKFDDGGNIERASVTFAYFLREAPKDAK